MCLSVCVLFTWRATEPSSLPYHGEFQSCGHDDLVWNKLAVLTAQTAPALGYKLKQKQPYLHISASSPWNPIRSALVFNPQQTERLPSSVLPSSLRTVFSSHTTHCIHIGLVFWDWNLSVCSLFIQVQAINTSMLCILLFFVCFLFYFCFDFFHGVLLSCF